MPKKEKLTVKSPKTKKRGLDKELIREQVHGKILESKKGFKTARGATLKTKSLQVPQTIRESDRLPKEYSKIKEVKPKDVAKGLTKFVNKIQTIERKIKDFISDEKMTRDEIMELNLSLLEAQNNAKKLEKLSKKKRK